MAKHILELDTPHGPARAHLADTRRGRARGLLVLGHGAGGGVEARDLVEAAEIALDAGLAVARVEQPYRVAGRRSPAPAHALDVDWVAAVEALRGVIRASVPMLVGGRSSGARVACRTAGLVRASGVLCLAFPLQPPQGARPEARPSRLPELEIVTVPVFVVQGENDAFGIPPAGQTREVIVVRGDHSLRAGLGTGAPALRAWIDRIVGTG
jgi:predicted alpha/beta-hydrolase family hydrolase